eukprot:CAMPEP_0179009116 /NCGR_PEP_ID=MMETSP0795-20121207/16100_1 /TAXON_ID=88552 /ORGANISM="Amoebophrya sp., Strain Ameob2" /LENGTH=68 /DNA_ID=CAMNT_0020704291 /DNA_START=286 /DNA_END=492 /DNA_ORIENTATION=+
MKAQTLPHQTLLKRDVLAEFHRFFVHHLNGRCRHAQPAAEHEDHERDQIRPVPRDRQPQHEKRREHER